MALTDAMFKMMDRFIGRLGYMKASDMPKLTQLLFAGEGATQAQGYITQTEAEAQRLAISNPWAYSNIMLISKRVAMGRMMVQIQDKAGEWQEDPLHEFTKIFEQQPNPYQGQMFIWMYQTFWLLLRGECYWMQVPDQTGKLTQVYPLPANRLEPIASDETLFSGFWYYPTQTGTPKFLPPENVIFNRLPNPFNYNRGLSPLSAYYLGLQIDEEARRFELEDYQQGLTLKHILSLRPEISDPDALRFKKEIDDAVQAGKRFMVVRGGDIKAAPLSARGGTDKESSNVRALTKMEADYVYNVPEGLRTSTATQANATVAERTFVADAIWPIMLLLTEDMTVQSVRKYYGEDQRARFEDPRIADKALAMQEDKHEWQYMTYDQVLESKGLEPYYNSEIGKQKFTVVDELIKMAFEQEMAQNEREQELNDREQTLAAQAAPEEDEGLNEPPDPVPDAFLELEADVNSKVAKGSELYRWLEEGWLPDPFNDNGKHMRGQHPQARHARRYSGSPGGSGRQLIRTSAKDRAGQRTLDPVYSDLPPELKARADNIIRAKDQHLDDIDLLHERHGDVSGKMKEIEDRQFTKYGDLDEFSKFQLQMIEVEGEQKKLKNQFYTDTSADRKVLFNHYEKEAKNKRENFIDFTEGIENKQREWLAATVGTPEGKQLSSDIVSMRRDQMVLNRNTLREKNRSVIKHNVDSSDGKPLTKTGKAIMQVSKNELETFIPEHAVPIEGINVSVYRKKHRASYNGNTMKIGATDNIGTYFHEYGHHFEGNSRQAKRKANQFVDRRTKGENFQKLSDATGNKAYRNDEITKPDKFFDPYIGKTYSHDKSTEVISMGIEALYENPLNLAKKDPEMFDLVYAIMKSG